ncbi:hypothetical protein [Desmospora activa]|uniref:Uncharacterized protein n=1 Tax=Desmospora activa DSM 45169 TaxID=1121389 RepID=A0A2T4ZA74_9BACL|nr:hypothetical protein [Desmospora activa]PTM58784.1 hypothetical protein C8J48_1377 [Desmospora activa DSM 45169]
MRAKWKPLLRSLLIYLVIIGVTLLGDQYYQQKQTQSYIQHFKDKKGQYLLNEIADTYKMTIELYSNYKLNKERKKGLVKKLNQLSNDLRKIDQEINSGNANHRIDFSFVYHDIKLVNIALSDSTKDDIIPVIILHGMEGLGELKKEITYIEYR